MVLITNKTPVIVAVAIATAIIMLASPNFALWFAAGLIIAKYFIDIFSPEVVIPYGKR